MSALRRIRKGAEFRSTLAYPEEWMFDAFGAQSTWAGTTFTTAKAMQIPAVRGAVSLISWAVSLCPLKVYRDEEDGTQASAEEHRAWSMLHDKPNEHIPADTYWQLVVRQLIRYGNHFSLKLRDPETGLVNELRPLPANTQVQINWTTYEKRYIVEFPDARGRQEYGVDQVLHIMGDPDEDGLRGISPLYEAREAIGTALARMEFEGSFYRRGATLQQVIQHPGKLSAKAIDKLKRSFSSQFGGSKKAFGSPVLEEGATAQTVGSPLRDLEFNESERRTRTDIALLLNLPSGFLAGDTGESLKYSTVEGNQIQFAQYAVAPWANRIAKAISADRSIFPFSSWYAEFVLEGLMRGDAASRSAVYKTLFEIADEDGRRAIEVNEVRALENRRPATKRAPAQPALPPATPVEDTDGTVNDAPVRTNVAQLRR